MNISSDKINSPYWNYAMAKPTNHPKSEHTTWVPPALPDKRQINGQLDLTEVLQSCMIKQTGI